MTQMEGYGTGETGRKKNKSGTHRIEIGTATGTRVHAIAGDRDSESFPKRRDVGMQCCILDY